MKVIFLLSTMFLYIPLTGKSASFVLPQDSLSNDSLEMVDLGNVVVTATRIINTSTGYQVRVTNKPLLKGKNAIEFLKYLPHISEENQELKINGLSINEITIDGRQASPSELQNLTADMLQSVEVKYAAGADKIVTNAGGTLAIKLKPLPPRGFYGNIQGQVLAVKKQGLGKESAGGTFASRVGKLSLYESVWGSTSDLKEWETHTNCYASGTEVRRNINHYKCKGFQNMLSLGYDFTPDHQLQLSWYTGFDKLDNRFSYEDSRLLLMLADAKSHYHSLAVNYTGQFNDKGSKLLVKGAWMKWSSDNDQFLYPDQQPEQSAQEIKKYVDENRSNIYQMSADFQQPLADKHVLNVGVAYNQVNNNLKLLKQQNQTQIPMPYASIQGRLGRIRYYGGLNWQMNILKIRNELTVRHSAFNPTAQFTIPFGDNGNQLTLLYKHTLAQVPYDAISEKKVWADAYNYSVGNKQLKAPSSHMASVGLSLLQHRINLMAYVDQTRNNIEWQTTNDAEQSGVFCTKPVNAHKTGFYMLGAELSNTFFKCWTVKLTGRFSLIKENSEIGGVYYNSKRFRQFYSFNTSLNLKYGWGGSLSAFVEPTYHSYDRTYHTVYQVDGTLYKTFLQDRLQLIANFTACGRRRAVDRMSGNQLIRMKYTTPVPAIGLRVVWYFQGGRRPVSVNMRNKSIDYQEVKDQI